MVKIITGGYVMTVSEFESAVKMNIKGVDKYFIPFKSNKNKTLQYSTDVPTIEELTEAIKELRSKKLIREKYNITIYKLNKTLRAYYKTDDIGQLINSL